MKRRGTATCYLTVRKQVTQKAGSHVPRQRHRSSIMTALPLSALLPRTTHTHGTAGRTSETGARIENAWAGDGPRCGGMGGNEPRVVYLDGKGEGIHIPREKEWFEDMTSRLYIKFRRGKGREGHDMV